MFTDITDDRICKSQISTAFIRDRLTARRSHAPVLQDYAENRPAFCMQINQGPDTRVEQGIITGQGDPG